MIPLLFSARIDDQESSVEFHNGTASGADKCLADQFARRQSPRGFRIEFDPNSVCDRGALERDGDDVDPALVLGRGLLVQQDQPSVVGHEKCQFRIDRGSHPDFAPRTDGWCSDLQGERPSGFDRVRLVVAHGKLTKKR